MKLRAAVAVILSLAVLILVIYLFQMNRRNSMDIHTYGTAYITRGINPTMPVRVPLDAVAISGVAGGYGGAYDGWHRGGGGYAGWSSGKMGDARFATNGRGAYGGSNPPAPQKWPLKPYSDITELEKKKAIESASMKR